MVYVYPGLHAKCPLIYWAFEQHYVLQHKIGTKNDEDIGDRIMERKLIALYDLIEKLP